MSQETDYKPIIESARNDVRDSTKESGHTLEGFGNALRGRDGTMETVHEVVTGEPGPDGRMIACRDGCAHCCHQLVATNSIEVLKIAEHIRKTWQKTDIASLLERLKRVADVPMTLEDRTSRNLPCPLLLDNRCSVYEIRPSSCRAMYSYSAEACSDGLDLSTSERGASNLIPSPDLPGYMTAAFNIGLDAGMIEKGLDTEKIDLAKSLLLALKDETTTKRWLKGKSPFKGARVELPIINEDLVKQSLKHFGL